jgi:hypothetical protein
MKARAREKQRLERAAGRGELLTTVEASTVTGYARDHIGLLVRKGTIKGSKHGRDWLLDSRSLLNYVISNPRPGRRKGSI